MSRAVAAGPSPSKHRAGSLVLARSGSPGHPPRECSTSRGNLGQPGDGAHSRQESGQGQTTLSVTQMGGGERRAWMSGSIRNPSMGIVHGGAMALAVFLEEPAVMGNESP